MNIQSEFAKVLGGRIYNYKLQFIFYLSGCNENCVTYNDGLFEYEGNYEDFKILVENEDEILKKELPYELCCMVLPSITLYKHSKNKKVNKEMFLAKLKEIVYNIANVNEEIMQTSWKYRKREFVVVRQIVMSVYYNAVSTVSLNEASSLYNKDHATTLHACKTIDNLIHTDKYFYEQWKDVFDFAFPDTPLSKIVLYNGK